MDICPVLAFGAPVRGFLYFVSASLLPGSRRRPHFGFPASGFSSIMFFNAIEA
jgi:hypothetical protein